MTKLKNIFFVSIASLFLSACGGGGGGSSTPTPPPPPVNVAPVANAGADQTVDEGVTVDLSGTGTDSDGTISIYAWSQVSGDAVSFADAAMQNTSFTAPSTGNQTSITVVLRLTVTDDDGATDTDDVSITINTTNQAPVASAGPNQSVDEQSIVTLDASASTDDGSIASYDWMQLTGAGVSIADFASATTTFDAPSLGTAEDLTFRLTVTDDRGSISTDEITVTVNPVAALNEAPLANAGPPQTVASGDMVILDGSLSIDSDGTIDSYAWAQLSGTPTVTLASADTANATFTAPTVTVDTVLSFIVTVTDNEGAIADDFVEITITPTPTAVTISGKATYDNVPHTAGSGLDYSSITQDPIRRAVVELRQGTSLSQTDLTDVNGNYSFDVNPNSGNYFVRIRSESVLDETAKWDIKVVDNTNTQALYALDGSNFDVTTSNITRPDMNAASGWGGASYTTTRAGAPFHILDRIMDGLLKIQIADPDVVFPLLEVNWSISNSATGSGSLADLRTGAIGTSFFTVFGASSAEFSGPQNFILGAADSDTDEYDGHVVIHEWGHYFENTLARSDSIGGSHSGNQRLDMRLAFGEGFGNAWSGIMTDDSFYRDSFGANQAQGFDINVDSNFATNEGWYNEKSVASVLYDLYDSVDDGADTTSLGLKPIYDVLIGQQRTTDAFTSIFSFATYLKAENPAAVAGINAILATQSISGNDIWGTGETNNAGAALNKYVLPVYTEISVGAAAVEVCSVDDFDPGDDGNKLSNFRYVKFDIATAGNYSFLVSATATQDPDMPIYSKGQELFFAVPGGDGEAGTVADSTFAFQPGTYTAELYEFDNTFRGTLAASADECFTVQVQTAP